MLTPYPDGQPMKTPRKGCVWQDLPGDPGKHPGLPPTLTPLPLTTPPGAAASQPATQLQTVATTPPATAASWQAARLHTAMTHGSDDGGWDGSD